MSVGIGKRRNKRAKRRAEGGFVPASKGTGECISSDPLNEAKSFEEWQRRMERLRPDLIELEAEVFESVPAASNLRSRLSHETQQRLKEIGQAISP